MKNEEIISTDSAKGKATGKKGSGGSTEGTFEVVFEVGESHADHGQWVNMPPPHNTNWMPREFSAGMTQREGVSGEEGSTTWLGFPRPALYTSQDSLITFWLHWKIL